MDAKDFTPRELEVEIERLEYSLQYAKRDKRNAIMQRIKELNERYNEIMLCGGKNGETKNEMGDC